MSAQARARTPPRPVRKRRQSQAERRDATRRRILEATLDCLAKHGYAGTGVAQVVARARVSRGAWAHHFPSMNALIVEAAEFLMERVYERLEVVVQGLTESGERVPALVRTVWREFFASEVNEIYLELLIAARRNPELARKLATLSGLLEEKLAGAAGLFYKSAPGAAASAAEVLFLSRWILRGIALDAPLMPAGGVERALDACTRLVSAQLRAR